MSVGRDWRTRVRPAPQTSGERGMLVDVRVGTDRPNDIDSQNKIPPVFLDWVQRDIQVEQTRSGIAQATSVQSPLL